MCAAALIDRYGAQGDGCGDVEGDGRSEDGKSNEGDEWEIGCQLAAGQVRLYKHADAECLHWHRPCSSREMLPCSNLWCQLFGPATCYLFRYRSPLFPAQVTRGRPRFDSVSCIVASVSVLVSTLYLLCTSVEQSNPLDVNLCPGSIACLTCPRATEQLAWKKIPAVSLFS